MQTTLTTTRSFKVKPDCHGRAMAIGKLGEIPSTPEGRRVVFYSLNGFTRGCEQAIRVDTVSLEEAHSRIFCMLLRLSFRNRDFVGNLLDRDFPLWAQAQDILWRVVHGSHGEDYISWLWYSIEGLLTDVFTQFPLYMLAEIHYSFKLNEIVFVADYSVGGCREVLIVDKDRNHVREYGKTITGWSGLSYP